MSALLTIWVLWGWGDVFKTDTTLLVNLEPFGSKLGTDPLLLFLNISILATDKDTPKIRPYFIIHHICLNF